jgi:hypothetical protein
LTHQQKKPLICLTATLYRQFEWGDKTNDSTTMRNSSPLTDRARTLSTQARSKPLVDDTASHTKATRTWKKNLTPAQNPTDRDASDYVTSIAVTKTKASWLELLSFLIGGE